MRARTRFVAPTRSWPCSYIQRVPNTVEAAGSHAFRQDKAMQRGEDVATANVRFKELQGAYECLSDARERSWC